jgi:hypothetical protein
MASCPSEKELGATDQKEKHSDDLERTQTEYDDNFHGLHVKTVLVYLVRRSLGSKIL